jgi:molybdopterin/thiamine biosynthesis adenylyltransferase
VQIFIDAVLMGEFYTSINQHLQFSAEDLKVNKVQTLMPIFSQKDPKRKTKFYKALEAIFPTFLNFVNSKKKDNHADAAKFLQKEESSIMIEKVSARLMSEDFWFLPVHDCILTTISNVERVKAIINEECQLYNGFNPHMKVSDWTGAKLELPLVRSPQEDKSFRTKNILDFTVEEKRRIRDQQLRHFKNKAKADKTKKVKK